MSINYYELVETRLFKKIQSRGKNVKRIKEGMRKIALLYDI